MNPSAHPPLDAAEKRIVAALSVSRLFAGIKTASLIELLPLCRVEKHPSGHEIFQDGDPGTNLYLIGKCQACFYQQLLYRNSIASRAINNPHTHTTVGIAQQSIARYGYALTVYA